MRNILTHIHPARVDAASLRFTRTFGLGGMAALLIVYWSGVFMLLISFLHFIRVFLTDAYRDIRKSNWMFGLFLLLLVVF